MTSQETIILSLGGSLIVPNEIDVGFLTAFNTFIRTQIAEKNRRFFIVCGGGATARKYINGARDVIGETITSDDKDWLGIHATRLNAHLMRTIFRDLANPTIIEHYDTPYDLDAHPVIVCSGWKPGWSTDYDAVMIAEQYGGKTIVNLSNIDQVFDKDPRVFPDAKPLKNMTWDFFKTLVGDTWTSGMNTPFDPIASKKAAGLGLHVYIVNGKNIANLEAAIDGKVFTGSKITP
ncbi:UMP kinase [Candidatus Microgenomates bacterium]|nr:MAG: UMP kinase [Candidatus Microgenomates bacterium]